MNEQRIKLLTLVITIRKACQENIMKNLFRGIAILGVLMLAVSAFLITSNGAAKADNTQAHVRVVHAAPAAPNVDVYVDGSKLLPNFAFGTVTDYVPLAAGAHQIVIVGAGQPQTPATISGSATVESGKKYTIAAIGNSNPAVTPSLVVFADDNSVSDNKAKARVYHLSDNAGAVSVSTGGNTVINSLAFKSASDYLNVPSGTYDFTVTLLDKQNTTVPLNGAQLAANKVTSVFALGEVGGSGATAFAFKVAVADGVSSSLPVTGATVTQSAGSMLAVWIGIAAILLLALGGTGYALAVRRNR
jgi:hypothetical protein